MDKVMNPEIGTKIKNLLDNPQVDERTKLGFLASLKYQYDRTGCLTGNQYTALVRIVENYSFDNATWKQDFLTSTKKDDFKIVVNFYRKTGYFANIVSKVNKDAGYIPTPKEFDSIATNKYAKMVIAGIRDTPKYKLGEMVRVRKPYRMDSYYFANTTVGTVLDYGDEIFTACNGNKVYKVYFASIGSTFDIEERKIAVARERDYDNMVEKEA